MSKNAFFYIIEGVFMKIGIPKEIHDGEKRVALTSIVNCFTQFFICRSINCWSYSINVNFKWRGVFQSM